MGPTGAEGILKECTYVVKYIFAQSPALGLLEIDDEVCGANGKKFAAHTFGRGTRGTWQLGKKCGIEADAEMVERSFAFLDHGTNTAGRIAYGEEFTLNNGRGAMAAIRM